MKLSPTLKYLLIALGVMWTMLISLGFISIVLSFTPWYAFVYNTTLVPPTWLAVPFYILGFINTWLYYIIFGLNHMDILSTLIGAPILEELECRGPLYLLDKKFNLSTKTKIGLSIISSLLFALWHGMPIGATLGIMICGLVLSWVVFKTKKLYPSIICHSIYNLVITILKG